MAAAASIRPSTTRWGASSESHFERSGDALAKAAGPPPGSAVLRQAFFCIGAYQGRIGWNPRVRLVLALFWGGRMRSNSVLRAGCLLLLASLLSCGGGGGSG